MLQGDGGPQGPHAETSPDAAVSALRTSLQCRLQGAISDDDVKLSLRPVCAQARNSGTSASDLIIMLKGIWATIPEIMREPASNRHDEARSRVVSLAIAEYYRPAPDGAAARSASPRA